MGYSWFQNVGIKVLEPVRESLVTDSWGAIVFKEGNFISSLDKVGDTMGGNGSSETMANNTKLFVEIT